MQKISIRKDVKALDLAIQAGRKRQSSQTGFVHLQDTIPLYENFCFAFALFRSRITDSVLEAKELLSKLIQFQVKDGNFPVYLHEYPSCKDSHHSLKIIPMLIHILRDYQGIFSPEYQAMIAEAIEKGTYNPVSAFWNHRYQAILGNAIALPDCNLTPFEWAEWIISQQLIESQGSYPIPFNQTLQVFTGDHKTQEGSEPQSLPIEYILGEEDGYLPRLLKDHLHQLHSAAILPLTSSTPNCEPRGRFLWGNSQVHSLVAPNGIIEKNIATFELTGDTESRKDDLFEALIFCSPGKVRVNGEIGTLFYLDDTISIETEDGTAIELQFKLIEGEGRFCGHISRGNRPHQLACKGENRFAAYDLQLGLRTLFREKSCQIAVSINITTC